MLVRLATSLVCAIAASMLAACSTGASSNPLTPTHLALSAMQTLTESTRADVRFGLAPQLIEAQRAKVSVGWWAHPDRKQPTLFVSDLNGGPPQIRIYPANVKNPTQSGSITQGIDLPINVAVDKQGTIYVANNGNSTVTEYPFGATSPSVTLSTQIVNPNGIAVDSHGTVYVTSGASVGSCYVLEFPKGSTSPSVQVNGFGLPIGLAIDSSDNLYVADAAFSNYKVWEVPAGTTSPQNLGLTGLADDTGAAVDGANDLYISNYSSNSVLGYHLGQTTPFVTISSPLHEPYALGFNSKGTLFVGNYSGFVTGFKKGHTTDFESFTSGMVTPTGIAVYKPTGF